jgi:replicative DNA helicase
MNDHIDEENNILGLALSQPDCIHEAMAKLQPEHFTDINRQIWSVMLGLYAEDIPIGIVPVSRRLKDDGCPSKINDISFPTYYLTSLATGTVSVETLDFSIQILINHRNAELLRESSQKTIELLNTNNYHDALSYLTATIDDIGQNDKQDITTAKDLLPDIMENLEKQKKGELDLGITTPIHRLNKVLRLMPGKLYIIAARPSDGKSALLLNMAEHVAYQLHHTALLFSLEMTNDELIRRQLLGHARVPSEHFLMNNEQAIDWEAIIRSSAYLSMHSDNLILCDLPRLTPTQIRALAKRENKKQKLSFIGIDYLTLVTPDNTKKNTNREQDVAAITRAFKLLSKELSVPVVLCAQLNRDNAKQKRKPRLEDLRESGAIEQDADVVMFIHHEREDDEARPTKSEILIAKNRGGPKGKVEVAWMQEYTKFENIAETATFNDIKRLEGLEL